MGAERLIPLGQIRLGGRVEVAECGGQTVGPMLMRRAAC